MAELSSNRCLMFAAYHLPPFDVVGNDAIGQLGVVDAVIVGFDVAGKVFTDKAIK